MGLSSWVCVGVLGSLVSPAPSLQAEQHMDFLVTKQSAVMADELKWRCF